MKHSILSISLATLLLTLLPASAGQGPTKDIVAQLRQFDFETLRLAIEDITTSHGLQYPKGPDYLRQLAQLRKQTETALAANKPSSPASADTLRQLLDRATDLQQRALLSNPLLNFEELILLRRKRGQLGLPVNHKCNSGIPRTGYDNDIAILSPPSPSGKLRTLYRPPGRRFVGEIDLHFDGDRLLFTMPGDKTWQIHEIATDGAGLRQISRSDHPDVDNFDACYLPNGRIACASTAGFHAVPCWHGKERACSIYSMDSDGRNVRQLCFDQDLDLHPAVLPTGQIIYSRWDYAGIMHIYLRPLMVMNPDGTGQRAVYGSNSYWPNALYFPRGIPGSPNKVIAVVSGYHGVPRMGELALIDIARGTHNADGIVQRIPGRAKPVQTVIRDNLVDKSWPKFLHPYPLSEKYFIVAAQLSAKAPWGIYLVDVFDNIVPMHISQDSDFFEPIPLRATAEPPDVPDRVDLTRDDAVVYLHDVYAGPGLAGVPRGTVERLRVVAYHFGYPGMAGPDKVGCGGPWEVMRILGTVPVYKDGSAIFKIPAQTPICLQPLDAEGKAVQLMRSWFTAMPGEKVSCVGCHENSSDIPAPGARIAAGRSPDEIEPWYGPARGFDFEREVQPVLDEHCVSCHNGQRGADKYAGPDLRSERLRPDYKGRKLTKLGATRLHPDVRNHLGGDAVRYTPAYEALIPYIRRVNVEDDVEMLTPAEYHADTSELIQMLAKGHHHVKLDFQAMDRLVTWIDLNGPCHGSWSEVAPIPDAAAQRRRSLAQEYHGPTDDPEQIPQPRYAAIKTEKPHVSSAGRMAVPTIQGWPFDRDRALRLQKQNEPHERTIDLGNGVAMKLMRIPAGRFVMGSVDGAADDRPPAALVIHRDFWIGACEVTNEQFAWFDASHNSGRFTKRFQGPDGPGLSLSGSKQPVVRVSWRQAMAYCKWLSEKTGVVFTLPSEAQWEYACRAGSAMPLHFGDTDADFSTWANCADFSLSLSPGPTGGLESNINLHFGKGILESAVAGGAVACDPRFNDKATATADVATYKPNAWGLYDMHGNAAEWTRDAYRHYPYGPASASDTGDDSAARVVRGGSFYDRPLRCRSAFRLSYQPWHRVHNVGFRIVYEIDDPQSPLVATNPVAR